MLRRRLFRALFALAALVAIAGALTPGVAGVVSPRYRVWRALPLEGVVSGIDLTPPGGWGSNDLVARRMTGLDPWGRPWSIVRASSANVWTRGPLVVTSAGPDGVDEGGAGDDVRLDGDMERVAVAPQDALVRSGRLEARRIARPE